MWHLTYTERRTLSEAISAAITLGFEPISVWHDGTTYLMPGRSDNRVAAAVDLVERHAKGGTGSASIRFRSLTSGYEYDIAIQLLVTQVLLDRGCSWAPDGATVEPQPNDEFAACARLLNRYSYDYQAA